MEMKICFDKESETPYAFKPTTEKLARVLKGSRLNSEMQAVPVDARMQQSLQSLFDDKSKSRMGLVGLQNLGNTCFMNSVLQCLCNTEPLVKFFLFEVHLTQINPKNSYGTRGKLAIAFSDIVFEMY
jgi:ubiquitin C-terminal hydrolase